MQFGAFVPQGWKHDLAGIETSLHWPTMQSLAKTIESLGFDSLWVYDHFHTVPVPTQEVTYEAWSLMAAFAAVTDKVRLGQMCTCNTYRTPSYLAKVAATIDQISGGRLEMGLGAGWYEHEHAGYGYTFRKPSDRIGMLREGVEIMKALWTEDVVDFDGRYYRLDGAICKPKPAQAPHIPIWIAGGGEKLTLRIAAVHANFTNFGTSLADFKHKSAVLERHCRDVGTDFDAIVRSSKFNIICAPSHQEVDTKISWYQRHLASYVGQDFDVTKTALNFDIAGTPQDIVDHLAEWRDAGMEYAIFDFPDVAFDPSSMSLFASTVIPAFT